MEEIKNQVKERSSSQAEVVRIAVAKGDGIGPEIMSSTLRILDAAGAKIEADFIEIGEQVYENGDSSGITSESWDTIRANQVILKAPISTPQGKGYKSLNVTLRKSLGLFANVRPVVALSPYVKSHFPNMDVVIIRENEEDLYAGIEHRQTQDVYQCLKLITRPGSERIIRYAFEYARAYGRKKVTCMVKDNIMKITDGLFHRVFIEIAAEYPEIESESQIIDIGSARLAASPESYDVIVTSNLYGDIISDIAAEIGGSVGMCGSANIGSKVSMFEAIHGSAPDIAGSGIANPSGLINAAINMLAHIGKSSIGDKIKNSWLTTLEQGYHTADIYQEGESFKKVSTQEFTDKLIENLGSIPNNLKASDLSNGTGQIVIPEYKRKRQIKRLHGIDVFVDWAGSNPEVIGQKLDALKTEKLRLKMITNRGVKVYPNGLEETYCTDHWRCRYIESGMSQGLQNSDLIDLLSHLDNAKIDIIKTEHLYTFNGERGYSLGQGE